MKILVVEDDRQLLEMMVKALEKEKFIVEQASDFSSASEKVMLYDYDLVVLDLTLVGGDGMDVLDQLKRRNEQASVLIVSARDGVGDKVRGLDMGADDYLTKPFHLMELVARIRTIIRRNNRSGSRFLHVGNMEIDPDKRVVLVGGVDLVLSRKEFDIIAYFAQRMGYVVSKEILAEAIWGDNIDQVDNFDFVYAQIKNVRRKLQAAGSEFSIQSIYGFGYKSVVL